MAQPLASLKETSGPIFSFKHLAFLKEFIGQSLF